MTEISPWVFSSTPLENIVIPDGVTKINEGAFHWTKIKYVVIPKSVTYIDKEVFGSCAQLEAVYYFGTPEEWENIYIDSYLNVYLTNAPRYYYSETEPTEDGSWWHYVDGVPTAW